MLNKLLPATLLLLPLLIGCSKGEAQQADKGVTELERMANVEVQTIHPARLDEFLILPGHTELMHDIILASEQGGTVLELHVDRGEHVAKGQILAKVSSDIYEAQLAEAQASLKIKEAGLKKAVTLFERGSISAMQRLQAQVDHDAAAANVDIAKSRLNRAIITAPFAGIIDDRFIDQGEMVSPGGQIFRLVDRGRMKILSELAEKDVSTFYPGIKAQVQFDAFPDTVFSATLVFVASNSHEASRTFACELELDNRSGLIRGGMYVRIRVLKETHHDVLVLPQTALVETESGRSVFVLEGDNAHRRGVTLGASNSGQVVVAVGLKPEETVVVSGQRDLVDGQKVKVTGRKD